MGFLLTLRPCSSGPNRPTACPFLLTMHRPGQSGLAGLQAQCGVQGAVQAPGRGGSRIVPKLWPGDRGQRCGGGGGAGWGWRTLCVKTQGDSGEGCPPTAPDFSIPPDPRRPSGMPQPVGCIPTVRFANTHNSGVLIVACAKRQAEGVTPLGVDVRQGTAEQRCFFLHESPLHPLKQMSDYFKAS